MLQLRNIKKDYKVADTTVHALKGISLDFRESEFVAILGHSGCGKTTLLNIVGGLDRFTSGDLLIDGRSTRQFTDADWDKLQSDLQAYKLDQFLAIFQKYVDASSDAALSAG